MRKTLLISLLFINLFYIYNYVSLLIAPIVTHWIWPIIFIGGMIVAISSFFHFGKYKTYPYISIFLVATSLCSIFAYFFGYLLANLMG